MNFSAVDNESCQVVAIVAPEDLRRGDFVAILSEIVECPSFLWPDALTGARPDLVRLSRLPTDDRVPLKIKAVCLPFVFVKQPGGTYQTIDVRLAQLGRLQRQYARTVWKSLKPPPAVPTSTI